MPSGMPANCSSGFPLVRRRLQVSGSWPGKCVLCARRIHQWKGNCRLRKGEAVFPMENVQPFVDGFRILDR
jgi:hypothetical protein